ncbi:MAG: hypothetical protein E7350_03610 [Clostridiales bacterium]|nr:hypothetical protein [Clostridiales bacterium]
MAIDVKVKKNYIQLNCKPIIPIEFKYNLLQQLANFYILKSDEEPVFTINRTTITEEERKELLKFYEQYDVDYSFEEFIELHMFPVGELDLYSKDRTKKIAFIDFVPDGDVYSIWIDVFDQNSKENLVQIIRNII